MSNTVTNIPLACIDKIVSIESGKSITAERFVDPKEEYFIDHFSGFPVLPGVLMLEAMNQSAGWLIREKEGFTKSLVYLKECLQVKYSQLVKPNARLRIEVQLISEDRGLYVFKGKVLDAEKSVATARFTMESTHIADKSVLHGHLEEPINTRQKAIFEGLTNKNFT